MENLKGLRRVTLIWLHSAHYHHARFWWLGKRPYSRDGHCSCGEDSWKKFPTFRFERKSTAICNLLFAKLVPVLKIHPGRCSQRHTEPAQDKGPGRWESSRSVHKSY